MYVGGVIDRTHQPLILMLMVLTPEDVSKVTNKEEYSTTTFIHTYFIQAYHNQRYTHTYMYYLPYHRYGNSIADEREQCYSVISTVVHTYVHTVHTYLLTGYLMLFIFQVRFGGQLTPQAVETLRLLKDAFGVVFKIKADVEMLQQQREQQREFFAAKRRKVSTQRVG